MISFSVNGEARKVDEGRGAEKLLDYLHDEMNLTGTKLCCGIGVCRACTVRVTKTGNEAGTPVIACSTALETLRDCAVTTVEGVSGEGLHPIQERFLEHFSFQCGYCTPGFVMAAVIFLDGLRGSGVTEAGLDTAIEDAIGPHICRCSGYVRYYEAVREEAMKVLDRERQG